MDEETVRSIRTISALLSAVLVISIALASYAQPNIPKEKIPSDIPDDVWQQIERLYSSETEERTNAAFRLRKMEDRAIPAVPFLVAVLKDKSTGVRTNAAQALGEINPSSGTSDCCT
jgi:HEAT repeat protein